MGLLRIWPLVLWLLPLVVWGQTLQDLVAQTPPCALTCFVNAVTEAGCSIIDINSLSPCLCTNQTLLTDLSGCSRLACDVPDQETGQGSLDLLCSAFPEETQQTELEVLASVSIGIAIASITMRWVARYQSSKLGWDDYTALMATLLVMGVAAIQMASATLGFGTHVWTVNPNNAFPLLQLYWASQQLYVLTQALVKISILLLYRRVFTTPWFQKTVNIGLVLLVLEKSAYLFLVIFRCQPIAAVWDVRLPSKCLDLNAIGFSGGVVGIVDHIIIMVLPLPELWKLRLSTRKKIHLALVFAIGSFSFVTSIIRLRYVTSSFSPTADLSWNTIPVIVWSLIEELSGVVCINMPPCRGLFGKILSKTWFSTTTKAGGPNTYDDDCTHQQRQRRYHGGSASRDHKYGVRSRGITVTTDYNVHRESKDGLDSYSVSALSSPELAVVMSRPSTARPADEEKKKKKKKRQWVEFAPGADVEMEMRRPHTAHIMDRLHVEIDRSDLGLTEAIGRAGRWTKNARPARSPVYTWYEET